MWIDSYITEIQRQFVVVYKFPAREDFPCIPKHVPDGNYPMWIDRKFDNVRVINGGIYCCNFGQPQPMTRPQP